MGLAKPALRLIAREHKRKPFEGPVLLLGRQGVYATLEEVQQLLREEGIPPRTLTNGENTRTNIPSWGDTAKASFTNDAAFFHLLGLSEVQAMDFSAFENAELVHDLNLPVPENLHHRFGLIVDSGTIEHVFDTRQVFVNIVRMLKPGARVLHLAPSNNYVNHGFYQFSPTLFFDFYNANGFADLSAVMVDAPRDFTNERSWKSFAIPNPSLPVDLKSPDFTGVFFHAEKTARSTAEKTPIQSYYASTYSQTLPVPSGVRSKMKRLFPKSLRTFLKRTLLVSDPENRLPVTLKALLQKLKPQRIEGIKYQGKI